jgi:hypothetical protein
MLLPNPLSLLSLPGTSFLLLAGSLPAAAIDRPSVLPVAPVVAQDERAREDAIFGPDLVVDGVVVSRAEIKRFIAMGKLGANLIEAAKIKIWIEEEIARRIASGEDPAGLGVTDAEVLATLAEAKQAVQEQGLRLEDVYKIKTEEILKDQIRLTHQFIKLFLPDNPHEYPPLTQEAMQAQGTLDAMLKNWDDMHGAGAEAPPPTEGAKIQDSVRASAAGEGASGVEDGPDGGQPPSAGSAAAPSATQGEAQPAPAAAPAQDPGTTLDQEQSDLFFKQLLAKFVTKYLGEISRIELPADGLPPEIALRVNGHDVRVDGVWNSIRDSVGSEDVRQAKLWFRNLLVAEKAFREAGVWVDDATAAVEYDKYVEIYRDSLFPIEFLARTVKKFPSLSDYRRYLRLYEAYRRLSNDQLTDENLIEHSKRRANALVGLSPIDAEVILVSAYDFAQGRWKEDGWRQAELRVAEVAKTLMNGGSWGELLDKHSEFYDPPMPANAPAPDPQTLKNKGRFMKVHRTGLIQKMEESEYLIFLSGTSLTDHMYFDMKVGETVGPVRGPYGYYILRLLSRGPQVKKLFVTQPDDRELLVNDYLTVHLATWVQDQVAKAKVQGI